MSDNVLLHFDHTFRIQDVGFHTINQLYTHPDRKLDWDVFLCVSDGQMQVWEEDTEYVVKKGEFLFLRSGLRHWGEPRTPAGTAWYWIHCYGHTNIEADQELNMNLDSYRSYAIAEEEYSKFVRLPKQGRLTNPNQLEKKLESLLHIFRLSDPFRAVTLSMQITQLFIDLFKEHKQTKPLSKSDRTVQRIVDYLELKDSYSLDAHELSSHLDMNYSYLCDVFKAKMKTTIHTYNAQICIDKAIGMMRHSSLNVSEISDRLGFTNPFYFSRVFRKVIGCPPSAYMSSIYRNNN